MNHNYILKCEYCKKPLMLYSRGDGICPNINCVGYGHLIDVQKALKKKEDKELKQTIIFIVSCLVILAIVIYNKH